MKVVVISDTHNQHEELGVLSGDVLIHCGDMFTLFGREDDDIAAIDDWFSRQRFERILCTGGNHDLALEAALTRHSQPFSHAHYLQDATVEIDGVRFHGAPWVPQLNGHAFFKSDAELDEIWRAVPDVDVLITHTPPAGKLDISSRGLELGCPSLAQSVRRIRPLLHCFGHVHASAGVLETADTIFANASSVNSQFEIDRTPLAFEISGGTARRCDL